MPSPCPGLCPPPRLPFLQSAFLAPRRGPPYHHHASHAPGTVEALLGVTALTAALSHTLPLSSSLGKYFFDPYNVPGIILGI